jgi:hypothetical protein
VVNLNDPPFTFHDAYPRFAKHVIASAGCLSSAAYRMRSCKNCLRTNIISGLCRVTCVGEIDLCTLGRRQNYRGPTRRRSVRQLPKRGGPIVPSTFR